MLDSGGLLKSDVSCRKAHIQQASVNMMRRIPLSGPCLASGGSLRTNEEEYIYISKFAWPSQL